MVVELSMLCSRTAIVFWPAHCAVSSVSDHQSVHL